MIIQVQILLLAIITIAAGDHPVKTQRCPTYCSLEYDPVCTVLYGRYREFGNQCELNSFNCRQNLDLQGRRGECPEGRPPRGRDRGKKVNNEEYVKVSLLDIL
ncbi:vasotab-like [Hermetia illucens]|uniref:vasotab-like n=1 Tax=Hermetia illucens TaxID=343691 RepID=UPI0018CC1066|nr:vasotab-like [Hermetia illucens]